ncbi:hypothetical protein PLESTB_000086700 [Pleodorina starrii]|uniref:Origin recognition complex subunit 1 n=1 Tax=Pleodorina starrii TaxID=330485 RepID=A0A9W6BB72_9CHLO|nr:hypothetical protein PLESTB_000086700 [Pleodorina starrii]GLC76553.1 hypothetical protein PLESTF_001796900 [Pleodorina starrii]
MLQEGRPSRAAKDAALNNKTWLDGAGAQPAPAAQQPPKQARITDTFPVRKGPAAAQKTAKQSTAVVASAPKATTAATERTKARAARTSAATQAASTRGRKRRNPPRAATDDDDESQEDEEEQLQEQQHAGAAQAATAPVGLRRSSRKATAAPPPPATAAPSRGAKPAAGKPATGKAGVAAAPPLRRRGGSAAAPRFLSSWEIEGEEFGVGDDVYVVETDDFDKLPDGVEEEECSVCSRNTDTTRMVECDRCLRGFHFRCLKPPLKKLPEGDWLCPDCEKGTPPSAVARRINTSCQAFLFGDKVLGLARICGWVRDRQGEVQVLVRHYKKPEETHLGRQSHHHSREVFLGVVEHQEPAGCVWGRAHVVRPNLFAETSGTDVYICEYEYDDKWKRFRRCLDSEDGQGAASDDDDEWGAAAAASGAGARRGGGAAAKSDKSDSDDDDSYDGEEDGEESDRDVEYKPRNTLDGWVIRKPRPGQLNTRTSGRNAGRAHSYKAIIDENGTGLLLDQGAAVVPDRGPVGQLAAARRALALNNCAGGLPCREAEKQALRRFIGQTVEEGGDSPGVLYICGVPGTGKTACVMEVLGGVRGAAQSSGVQLVILNALQLPSPQHVYSKLWERMSGQRWGPARALKALEEYFSGGGGGGGGSGRHVTLLIVDEIDVLITKDQAVLYNLFEWPLREGSRLAVIGISNTHDLDSRVLPRIASRLSGSKLAFNPYNFEQLKEILNSRLQGVTAVARAAVDFCARKVASTTGDVRRALELLRRATEIAETELAHKQRQQQQQQLGAAPPPPVDLTNAVGARQAHAAIREMYGSVHMTLLRSAGLYPKLVLTALLVETRAQNKPEVTVASLHHRLTTHLALLMRSAALPLARVVEAAAVLGAQRLVLAEPGWQGPGMRLTLNVPQDDLTALLREDPALAPVQSCLA